MREFKEVIEHDADEMLIYHNIDGQEKVLMYYLSRKQAHVDAAEYYSKKEVTLH